MTDKRGVEYISFLEEELERFQFLKVLNEIEDHPQFENFIRAFWRRVEPYKNDYEKELPEKLPVELKASMATALLQLER